SSGEVFREYARLTAYENDGRRFLDLAGLVGTDYEFAPVQWPVAGEAGPQRLFTDGRFKTPDGRARMVVVEPRPPAEAVDGGFPFALNTGRVRDQWHTMNRTALAPELNLHAPEPFVEIHAEDAAAAGLTEG